jgi:hypothetical protein
MDSYNDCNREMSQTSGSAQRQTQQQVQKQNSQQHSGQNGGSKAALLQRKHQQLLDQQQDNCFNCHVMLKHYPNKTNAHHNPQAQKQVAYPATRGSFRE